MRWVSHASSSAGNLYEWQSPSGPALLLECGVAKSRLDVMLGHSFKRFDACLLSHHHGDHSRGLAHVLRFGVPVLGDLATFEALECAATPGVRPVVAGEPWTIESKGGAWVGASFELAHECAGTVGFLVDRWDGGAERRAGRLLFACDTAHVPFTASGVTHLAVECNFSEALLLTSDVLPHVRRRSLRTHLSLERLLDWLGHLDKSELREVHLLHLSAAHSDADLFRSRVAEATGVPVHIAPALREGVAPDRRTRP